MAAVFHRPCPCRGPLGLDEGSTVPARKTGHAPPALTAKAGSDGPTARARVEGKPGQRTPPYAATALCGGERLATVNRHPGYTVLQSAPSYAAALLEQGRGRVRKADYCQEVRWCDELLNGLFSEVDR
jgi:hypothetical protein